MTQNTRAKASVDVAMDKFAVREFLRGDSSENKNQMERVLKNLPIAIDRELTARQRQILRMRFYQEKSVSEIARELGISKSAVSKSIARSTYLLFRVLQYSL